MVGEAYCKNSKMSAVNNYLQGVQRIMNHNRNNYMLMSEDDLIAASPDICAALALSIRLREKVTAA
jgi:hypothetical protein